MTDYNPKDTYGSYPSSNPTNITIPMMSHDNESQHHHSVSLTPGSRSVNSKRDINKSGNAANNSNDPGQTVERKRRDNINERIQELGAIIPSQFFDLSKEKSSGTKDGKPNKGQILSKSIEYVEFLQDKIDENNKKEIELLIILKKLEEIKQLPDNLRPSKSLFKHTSAEIELSNIGVGPLAENSNKTNNTTSNNNNNNSGNGNTNNNSGNGNTNNNSMTPNQRASPTVNSPSVNFDRTKRASIASIGSPLANATNNDNINSNVPSPMSTKFEQNITPVSNSDSNINNNNNNNNTNFGNSNISSNYNKLSATIMDNDQNFSMGFDQSTVGNNNNGNGNGDESNNSFNASVNNNNGNFGQNTYNNTNNNTNNNNNNNNHSINPTNFMIKPEDYENFGFNFDV